MINNDFQNGLYGRLDSYTDRDKDYSSEFSVRRIREYIRKLAKNQRILDIGCADGGLLVNFSGVHRLYGVDIAEPLIKMAQNRGIRPKQRIWKCHFHLKGSFLMFA